MSPAVAAEGVTRRFGRRWALRGVDLEVPRGAVVALLGANGTGKTTLLRVISTLLKPTAGRVEVLGHTLPAGGDAIRARAAFMTAGGHAYEELTGVENLRFAARMSGTAATDADLREALAAVDLGGAADVPVRGWSTGMRKRLELARLRLRPLQLVLLDEPFVSLDEDGVGLVHDAVRAWREAGAAVLIASHRVDDATRHADEVVRLEAGRVAAEDGGSPQKADEPTRRPVRALARRAAAILWKDILSETRTRQGFTAMVSFAALVLFLFSFAIGADNELLGRLAGGLLWVAIVFTGTLSLSRTFQNEELAGGAHLLRLFPGDVRAIYLGKLAGNLVVLAALEIVLFPAAAILYEVDFAAHAGPLLLVAVLGTLGFSVIGTFFSALTVHFRARELLLPLLLFPALVPVVLGSVGATDAFLAGDPLGRAAGWLRLLASYDVILFVVCVWIFPVVLEE